MGFNFFSLFIFECPLYLHCLVMLLQLTPISRTFCFILVPNFFIFTEANKWLVKSRVQNHFLILKQIRKLNAWQKTNKIKQFPAETCQSGIIKNKWCSSKSKFSTYNMNHKTEADVNIKIHENPDCIAWAQAKKKGNRIEIATWAWTNKSDSSHSHLQ